MIFIETPVFTRLVTSLLSDEEYRRLQAMLAANPAIGAVIPGSGGLRKIRWVFGGRGKRGGTRIIYYWATADEQILLLYIYPKNVLDDLSPQQLKLLREIVEEEYG